MTKNHQTIIATGIPVLIIILLGKRTIEPWWQLIHPDSYRQYFYAHYLPTTRSLLLDALFFTGIIITALVAAVYRKPWAYYSIKWLLIIAVPFSMSAFWHFLTRLWDYGAVQYAGNGLHREIPLSVNEQWFDIYLPILGWLVAIAACIIGLWLWTTTPIKSKFVRQLPPT